MSALAVRLQVILERTAGEVCFAGEFAAPEEETLPLIAELLTGDGARYDLGVISPPSAVTWREQRSIPLVTHTYRGAGPYTAELLVNGSAAASAVVQPGAAVARGPNPDDEGEIAPLFAIAPIRDAPSQRLLKLEARPLLPGQRLRVDGGVGQVREFAGEDGQTLVAEILLTYPKPGTYLVSVDLLDGEGFWLETLAQTPLEIAEPAEQTYAETLPIAPQPRAPEFETSLAGMPWLPYRNFKSKPGGARTYAQAGGGAVRRYVGTGVWLTARKEAMAGGARWYQTAGNDWIKADAVEFFEPSNLRGIVLDATTPPPPPPPPPPTGQRKGVVTATTLNVRARPGVTANNPPTGVLRAGAQVSIFEEQLAGGEIWYRIGLNRWVVGRWVRLQEAPRTASRDLVAAGKIALPFGWVVPETLEVRARPGVSTGNPAIGQLRHYDICQILEEAKANGAAWYRTGEQSWVEARQIGVARLRRRPSSIGKDTQWVAANLSQQTVVCYEGDRPVYAALAATGVSGSPTVQGIFRTWRRLETGKMSGPGYYIEDVTWTCYFYSGYALHTAYWHDKFGRPRSHGCVNLSPYDAWWIYQWSARGGPNSPTVYAYWA